MMRSWYYFYRWYEFFRGYGNRRLVSLAKAYLFFVGETVRIHPDNFLKDQ